MSFFSHNIWCHFRLCSTSTRHMKLNFYCFSECGTLSIKLFSLHNKWTGNFTNLHKYNDDTELLNSCEALLINFKIV